MIVEIKARPKTDGIVEFLEANSATKIDFDTNYAAAIYAYIILY